MEEIFAAWWVLWQRFIRSTQKSVRSCSTAAGFALALNTQSTHQNVDDTCNIVGLRSENCRRPFYWLRNPSPVNGEKEWADDGELEQLKLSWGDRKLIAALALRYGGLGTLGRVKSPRLAWMEARGRRLLRWRKAGWRGKRRLIDRRESS